MGADLGIVKAANGLITPREDPRAGPVRRWRLRAVAIGSLMTVLWAGCASVPQPEKAVARDKAVKGKATASARSVSDGDLGSRYHQALSDYQAGRLEEAQRLLESLVSAYPDRIEPLNTLGVVYRKRGMLDQAIQTYQKAIALSERPGPNAFKRSISSELYNNLGITYRERGDFKKSEEAYRKAIALNPKFSAAYYNLGVLYDLYMNRLAEAVQFYREYERLGGDGTRVGVWIEDLDQRIARETKDATRKP